MKRVLSLVIMCLLAVPVLATEQPVAPAVAGSQPAVPGPALVPVAQKAAQPTVTARIGVVDINRVSVESVMGKAAQNQIRSQQAKLQKQIEAKRKQLDAFKADTERQFPALSPRQREAKSKEFQKKIEAFQKFGISAEKDLMASQQRLNKELFEAIGKAAEELGKAKGLSALVINRELLYLGTGVESLDMTAALVTLLDEKGAKK